MDADRSNGYEAVSECFLAGRGSGGSIGAGVVREWARNLPQGASVLDIGCGSGLPISKVLVEEGLTVAGVDASASMIEAFRRNFPSARAEWSAAEESTFFDAEYEAVIAWGLIFLLTPEIEGQLIRKVAAALKAGGRFLFTAPQQECSWRDAMTGRECNSLGSAGYRNILESVGLSIACEATDEGENFYYLAVRT